MKRVMNALELFLFVCLVGLTWSSTAIAGPPVAPTDPLPPNEQASKFKLPPGFEIQLVAAEPDIQKPMNLAFDARTVVGDSFHRVSVRSR